MKKEFYASLVLLSTIIGIGIFALPYAFWQSGYWFIFWLIFWIFGLSFLHFLYASLLEKANKKENFPGLLAEFLHPKLRSIGWLLDLTAYGTVLLIYFLVAGEFLPKLLPFLSFFSAKAIFAFFGLAVGILGLLKFARLESLFSFLMIVFTLVISFYFWQKAPELKLSFLQQDPFFAYGSIVFAYAGISAIPIVYDLLRERKKVLQVSLITYFLIALLYLVFAFSVIKFFGPEVADLSLRSFLPVLPGSLFLLLILLVLINIFTTSASMFFYLKRGLQNEFALPKWQTVFLLFLFTLFLVSLPKMKFISLVNLVGEVLLSLEFFLLVVMAYKISWRRGLKICLVFLGALLLTAFFYGLR